MAVEASGNIDQEVADAAEAWVDAVRADRAANQAAEANPSSMGHYVVRLEAHLAAIRAAMRLDMLIDVRRGLRENAASQEDADAQP